MYMWVCVCVCVQWNFKLKTRNEGREITTLYDVTQRRLILVRTIEHPASSIRTRSCNFDYWSKSIYRQPRGRYDQTTSSTGSRISRPGQVV